MNETATFTCSMCGAEYPISDRTDFDGEHLCPQCMREHTRRCNQCGDIIWADENCGNDFRVLCEDCYNDYYSVAYDLGEGH